MIDIEIILFNALQSLNHMKVLLRIGASSKFELKEKVVNVLAAQGDAAWHTDLDQGAGLAPLHCSTQ